MAKAVYVGVDSKARKMKKAYVGIDGKARKVKKMYIGDSSGKARLCYSAELERHGMAAALSVARYDVRTATVGNYALFAGGEDADYDNYNVDAYDASLTRTAAPYLARADNRDAATTVGNHAVFVGSTVSADIYDASLTRTSAAILSTERTGLAATTVGNYAIFSGGGVADFCDASLTRSSIDTSMTGYNMGAATIGDYALFAGGHANVSVPGKYPAASSDTAYDSVEVYTA